MGFFYIKRLIGVVLQPAPVVIVLLALAFLLLLRIGLVRRFLGTLCLLAALLLFAATAFPQPVRFVARELEHDYKPILSRSEVAGEPDAIVILGNEVEYPGDRELPGLTRLGHTARARLAEGVRLSRLFPEARLITCGYGMGLENCADVMRDAAVELGVDPGRIDVLNTGMDTEDEAKKACELADKKTLIVVTTAVHMERAVGFFKACGATVFPSPCDYIAPRSDRVYADVAKRRWRPKGGNMTNNEKVWHEMLGLLHQRYFGGDREGPGDD